ncbi:MAG: class I SAM-dependent methyltransferase [Desulfobacterales bacterium]
MIRKSSRADLHQTKRRTAKKLACPSCASANMQLFHEITDVPVNSVLNVASRDEALHFPRGDLALGFCRVCGFISNTAFNPELIRYSSDCEESQGYSETFNAFAEALAIELVEKYDLHHKRIVEIGCGKGEFLKLICEIGHNWGVGFDPAYVGGRGSDSSSERLEFIKDYYSEKYADYHGDMVCCRMTLEHIHKTAELIKSVRYAIGDRKDTIVFFQVPDVTRILRECAFEDIYYEHCSYFSPGSLARLFRSCRFDILELKTVYQGQYLIIETKPASKPTQPKLPFEKDLQGLEKYIRNFKERYAAAVQFWCDFIEKAKKENKQTVIWGSGSKGVTFLNSVPNSNFIDYAVDINPYRQGTFMAGTGQAIVAPEYLKSYRPDVVIVMNSVYRKEIRHNLSQMKLNPAILALGEPQTRKI